MSYPREDPKHLVDVYAVLTIMEDLQGLGRQVMFESLPFWTTKSTETNTVVQVNKTYHQFLISKRMNHIYATKANNIKVYKGFQNKRQLRTMVSLPWMECLLISGFMFLSSLEAYQSLVLIILPRREN